MTRSHKITCKRGHPLTGENIYVSPGGQRQCRECRKLRQSAHVPTEDARRRAVEKARQRYLADPQRHHRYTAEWARRNPEIARVYQLRHRLKRYGLTEADYLNMLETQGHLCAICRGPETRTDRNGRTYLLAVDHCHESGVVRGLLCQECNKGLGAFDDDPDRLRAAADYLIGGRHGPSRGGIGGQRAATS